MNPVSIAAIVVALIVFVVGLARAATARKEADDAKRALDEERGELGAAKRALDEERGELGEAKRALEEAREKLRALEARAKEEKPKPAEKETKAEEPKPAEKETKAEEPKPPKGPAKPEVDQVGKRADKMLHDARALARFVGFDNQIDIDGHKGVRVTVPIKDDLDKQAFERLRTSDAVLDVGERNGERFVVVRA